MKVSETTDLKQNKMKNSHHANLQWVKQWDELEFMETDFKSFTFELSLWKDSSKGYILPCPLQRANIH